jgi:hypothetical protein
MYEPAGTQLHFGIAYNQDDDIPEPAFLQAPNAGFYTVNNYKTFQYGYLNRKSKEGEYSFLIFNAGYQNLDNTVSYKQTYGARGVRAIGSIEFAGDFYYQGGELNNLPVSAFLAGINGTVETKLTPVTIGVEYISGQDSDDNEGINNFSPDFGTNHAHNGLMDYFFVGPQNGQVGVTDLYVQTKFSVLSGSLAANVHHFLTGSDQFSNGEKLSPSMGTEFDFVYQTKIKGVVTWHLGYSQMFATQTMEVLRGGDRGNIQNWAWTMITFKPTLFSSER